MTAGKLEALAGQWDMTAAFFRERGAPAELLLPMTRGVSVASALAGALRAFDTAEGLGFSVGFDAAEPVERLQRALQEAEDALAAWLKARPHLQPPTAHREAIESVAQDLAFREAQERLGAAVRGGSKAEITAAADALNAVLEARK
jgi:hypothetical protein